MFYGSSQLTRLGNYSSGPSRHRLHDHVQIQITIIGFKKTICRIQAGPIHYCALPSSLNILHSPRNAGKQSNARASMCVCVCRLDKQVGQYLSTSNLTRALIMLKVFSNLSRPSISCFTNRSITTQMLLPATRENFSIQGTKCMCVCLYKL